jgi:hypothetical protein
MARAETRFRLSAKRMSPFKSAGASVQLNTGSRGVRVSGSNVKYTMFRVSVKSTGYPLHPLVSLSLPLPCITVCHHVSAGLYAMTTGLAVNRISFTSSSGLSRLHRRRVALLRLLGPEDEVITLRSYVRSQKTCIFVKKLISLLGILNQLSYANLQGSVYR